MLVREFMVFNVFLSDRNDKNAVVFDMDPDPTEITVGTKVIAHWSGLSAYLPGIVARIEGNKYYVHYDDGDKGNNSLQQMRILKPPLFFGKSPYFLFILST